MVLPSLQNLIPFFSNTCQIFDFVGSSMRIMDRIQDTAHSSVKSLEIWSNIQVDKMLISTRLKRL